VIDDLKSQIHAMSGKRAASKLRAVMPDIEQKIREGFRHEDIVEALEKAGLKIHIEAFRGHLYRYRKKQPKVATPERGVPMDIAPGDAQRWDSISTPIPTAQPEKSDFDSFFDAGVQDLRNEKYINQTRPITTKQRNET